MFACIGQRVRMKEIREAEMKTLILVLLLLAGSVGPALACPEGYYPCGEGDALCCPE